MNKQILLLDKALWVLSAIRHFEQKKQTFVHLSKSPLNLNTHWEELLMDRADTCQRAINRLKDYYNKTAIEIAVYQLTLTTESVNTKF